MRIVVDEKTKQVIFEPSEEYFKNFVYQNMSDDEDFLNGIRTKKSKEKYIKTFAQVQTTREEQKEYFHQKRDEMLPYSITVDMPFDVYRDTEQWIVDTLGGGMWARKYESTPIDQTNTASSPPYSYGSPVGVRLLVSPPNRKQATFWFEHEKDRIAFKLMYG